METWSFTNIGNKNYLTFPVSFFDGSHDEDDGAEQNYAYNGDIFQIQAHSDDHSRHYLKVLSLSQGEGNLVLVTNSSGAVLGPMLTNTLAWMSLSAASDSTTPPVIGQVVTNQTSLGVGLVDLSLLFSDPNDVSTYMAAIAAGNLTFAQSSALASALTKAIESPAATAAVAASR